MLVVIYPIQCHPLSSNMPCMPQLRYLCGLEATGMIASWLLQLVIISYIYLYLHLYIYIYIIYLFYYIYIYIYIHVYEYIILYVCMCAYFIHGMPENTMHASKASSVNSGPKPTFLYSNYKFFQKLYLPLPDREWTNSMVRRQGTS